MTSRPAAVIDRVTLIVGESVTGMQQGYGKAPYRYRVGQVTGGTVW
jgi:hypothetical protein